jgi:cytochrome c-type biogenesis protein CcmH/NrfG
VHIVLQVQCQLFPSSLAVAAWQCLQSPGLGCGAHAPSLDEAVQHLKLQQPADNLDAALEAARASPDDVAAWQLLGRRLSGLEVVNLQGAFRSADADKCIAAFSQHTAPCLAGLKSLDLSHNHLTAAGATA